MDYLTKPIERPRLKLALDRIRGNRAAFSALAMQAQLSKLLESFAHRTNSTLDPAQRLRVRDGDKDLIVPVSEVEWIEAADYYSSLHVGKRTYLLRESVAESFGPKPTGLLCSYESLHFVELMSDPSVPRFASDEREAGTAEEDKAAVIGNLALFGTYTVDGEGNFTGSLVQGCTFPNWIGDQRTAEQLKEVVDGDHMREIFPEWRCARGNSLAACNRTLVGR